MYPSNTKTITTSSNSDEERGYPLPELGTTAST